MAQELLIIVLCDLCQKGETRTEADYSTVLSIDGGKPISIDLCTEHALPVRRTLEMIKETGLPADETKRKGPRPIASPDDRVTCPIPDCGFASASRGGLGKHLRAQHGTTLTAQRVAAAPTAAQSCDICGQECANPQGLGAHKKARHGIVGEYTQRNAVQRARDRQRREQGAQLTA